MLNSLESARRALQKPTGKFYSKGFDFDWKGTWVFGDDEPRDTLEEAVSKVFCQCEYYFVLDCSQATPILYLIEKYEKGEHPLFEWLQEHVHLCLEANGITIDRGAPIANNIPLENWIFGAEIKFDWDGCKFFSN
jgi:hypothetical protein